MAITSPSGIYRGVATRADGQDIPGGLVNDGATILKGGNADVTAELGQGQAVTVSKRLDQFATYENKDYGSKVLHNDAGPDGATGDSTGIGSPRYFGDHTASGTFAFSPDPADRTAADPQFIIRGVSTTINASANTTLKSAGSDYAGFGYDGVADLGTTTRKGADVDAKVNLLAQPSTTNNPARTKGTDAGVAVTYTTASGNLFGESEESKVGRTYGGGITIMQGGVNPSGADYKRRDTGEGTG